MLCKAAQGEVMAVITLLRGERMLLDDEDVSLFDGISLYAANSRNTKYAYFSNGGIAHRLIMGVKDRQLTVDHLNGDGLDNRRQNLRVVPARVNVKNHRVSRNKTAGLPPGIFMDKNRFFVQVTEDYKKIFVGRFDTRDEAIVALNKKRVELGRPPV